MTKKQESFMSSQAELVMTRLMIELVKENAESGNQICADDLYERAVAAEVFPKYISKFVPLLFRTFKSTGWLRKSKNYTLSRRLFNSSSVLPLYDCLKVSK